jgi:formate dehydrogenase major subunit
MPLCGCLHGPAQKGLPEDAHLASVVGMLPLLSACDFTAQAQPGLTNRVRAKRHAKERLAEKTDPSLQHPRCVFQVLKRHFHRYTPEMVERTCGIPPRLFLKVAETLCRNSGRERTSAFCYAVGWTQHTVGVQYIRTACIIQLLLGNIGRPGGGVMALRGHASIQGSTDIPTLYNLLPGYLPMPRARHDRDLKTYNI